MPLIRATEPLKEAPKATGEGWFAQLGEADPAQRRAAARHLGWNAPREPARQALAQQLRLEADETVREALFSALVELGGSEVAGCIGELLHHEDPALRNGALEALKLLGAEAAAVVQVLLTDSDPVVRLRAAEVLRAWPCTQARPLLVRQLGCETDANVCGLLFDLTIALGDMGLLAALAACAARFADDPFLNFAYDVAQDALTKAATA